MQFSITIGTNRTRGVIGICFIYESLEAIENYGISQIFGGKINGGMPFISLGILGLKVKESVFF
jgi:hypothetical protein